MEIEVLWHGDYCNLIREYYIKNIIDCNEDYVQVVRPIGAVVSHNAVVCLVSTNNTMELVSVDKKGIINVINKKAMKYDKNNLYLGNDSIWKWFMNIELEMRNYNYDFESKELLKVIENNRRLILSSFNDKENAHNIDELIENVIRITKEDNDIKLM